MATAHSSQPSIRYVNNVAVVMAQGAESLGNAVEALRRALLETPKMFGVVMLGVSVGERIDPRFSSESLKNERISVRRVAKTANLEAEYENFAATQSARSERMKRNLRAYSANAQKVAATS